MMYSMRIFLLLAVLSPSLGLSYAATGKQCVTLIPHRPIEEATIAGMRRYQAFKANQTAAKGFKSFLNAIFSFGVSQNISNALITPTAEAANHLKWTGQKGGLVEVLLQKPIAADFPAELLSVGFVGGGDCPYNVLTEVLAKDQMRPGPKQGYKLDNDASFFVWVTVQNRAAKISTVAPGSRGLIVEKVLGDNAAQVVLASSANVREIDQLRSLVREIERVETSEQVKGQVLDAFKKREEIKNELDSVERSLQRALKEQASVAQAGAWIDSLDQVLTFSKLVMQVSSLIDKAPQSIIDAVKNAKTKEELKAALGEYQKITLHTLTSYENDKKIIQDRIVMYRKTIIDSAKKNGAPATALELPSMR